MSSRFSPREISASLVSSLSICERTNSEQSLNPLINAPETVQHLLLTIHVLFPNELLPALDLLDRGLVTRLQLQDEETQPGIAQTQPTVNTAARQDLPSQSQQQQSNFQDPPSASRENAPRTTPFRSTTNPSRSHVYIVRSAQQSSSRARTINHTSSYEVRLDAWTCSCPAFAFAAFPAIATDGQVSIDTRPKAIRNVGWKFGGLTLGNDMPMCKHLLACVLVEHAGMFASFAEERRVSIEEMAGWTAGWGD